MYGSCRRCGTGVRRTGDCEYRAGPAGEYGDDLAAYQRMVQAALAQASEIVAAAP